MQKLRKRAKQAVRVLNEINAADPSVLPALIAYRVPCNTELANHPTVQVGYIGGQNPFTVDEELAIIQGPGPHFEVGLLGIINGLFGTDERSWGFIYMHQREDGSIEKFSVKPKKEKKRDRDRDGSTTNQDLGSGRGTDEAGRSDNAGAEPGGPSSSDPTRSSYA